MIHGKIEATGNIAALGTFGGWFVGFLPSVATLLTVVWFAILITEKVTGRAFVDLVRCAVAWVKSLFNKV